MAGVFNVLQCLRDNRSIAVTVGDDFVWGLANSIEDHGFHAALLVPILRSIKVRAALEVDARGVGCC